jgi:hypothetical protein
MDGGELNIVTLVKEDQRFVFIFDDENKERIRPEVAKFAADPKVPMSWFDAAMVLAEMRKHEDKVSAQLFRKR